MKSRSSDRTPDGSRARNRRGSHARDEWVAGLSVLAAPVRSGDRMLAALAVAASSQRFDALGADELARSALAAAGRVAARLAGTSA